MRYAFVRIGHNHLRRQLGIQGLPAKGLHNRVIDEASHQLTLPANGLVMSAKLAEALDVKVGNELMVEVLEGKRPLRRVPLVELAEDFSGVAAYMERHALNRLLGEGDIITGASLRIDPARRRDFLRALKAIPHQRVATRKFPPDYCRQYRADSNNLPDFRHYCCFRRSL